MQAYFRLFAAVLFLIEAGFSSLPARGEPHPPAFLPKDQWPPGLLHASDHEDVLDIFWEPTLYELGSVWKTGGDMGSRFEAKKIWCNLNIYQTFDPKGGNTGLLERDYSQPLGDEDSLIIHVNLTRGQKLRATAKVNGKELPPVEKIGADGWDEMVVPLPPGDGPRTLTHLALAFLPTDAAGSSGSKTAALTWILLHRPPPAGGGAKTVDTLPPAPPSPEAAPTHYPEEFAAGLILTPAEADAWRKGLLASPAGAKMAGVIEKLAKKWVAYDPAPFIGDYAPIIDKRVSRVGANDEGWDEKLTFLSTAYLITGNEAYGQAARRLLLAMARSRNWTTSFVLRVLPGSRGQAPFPESAYLTAASLGYDWCYGLLTEPERAEVAQAIFHNGVQQIGEWLKTGDYWRKMNQGSVFNSPMVLGALAVQSRIPEAKDYLEYGKANLLENLNLAFDEDGAGYEGIGYWNYLMHVGINALGALEHAEPGFLQSATGPWRKSMPYVLALRSTDRQDKYDGENIGDTHFGAAPGTNVLSFYSHYLHDPVARALWWQTFGNEHVPYDVSVVWAALWFDPNPYTPKPEELAAPAASWFHGVGLVNFRAGADGNAANLLFLSGPWGRNHEDKNSFLLEAYGERFATDPGMIAYSDPRCMLMQLGEFHNIVQINGKDQDNPGSHREDGAKVTAYASDARLALVSSDAGAAYKAATRYVRSVLFLRPNLFFIVDDVAAPAESDLVWRMNTPLPLAINGNSALVTGAKATLKVVSLAPADVRLSQRTIFADTPDTRQLLVQCRAKDTRIVHLLQATPTGQTAPEAAQIAGDNAVAASVATPDGTAWFIAATGPGSWKVQEWSGDARAAALLVRDGRVVDAAWIEGTELAGKGGPLALPSASGMLNPPAAP